MAIAAVAFALDPSSETRPTAPEPVSVSTPVPVPISVSTPVPVPVSESAMPSPFVAPPAFPIIEQATQREPSGAGNGKGGENGRGNGHGNGNKKPK